MRRRSDSPTGREVFEILAREHADMLTAFLRSLVFDTNAVDDLFQETMLVAWRRLDAYDRSLPFGPWLRGIAARLVCQHRRQSARRFLNCDPAVLEALEHEFTRMASVPGDSFRDRVERLRSCIGRLPEQMRDVIDLGYARGLMLKQIAELLSASEEAIKKRVQRARQLLLDCLQTPGT